MTIEPTRMHDDSKQALSKQAPDLALDERAVAGWFAAVGRPDAPAALRARVLAPPSVPTAGRLLHLPSLVLGRALGRRGPLGRWGMATAALVLVALGAALAIETLDPVQPGPDPATRIQGRSGRSLVIVEDPTMALFHDLATFDEVGRASDELIADWQR
jgi:hypothetical protein